MQQQRFWENPKIAHLILNFVLEMRTFDFRFEKHLIFHLIFTEAALRDHVARSAVTLVHDGVQDWNFLAGPLGFDLQVQALSVSSKMNMYQNLWHAFKIVVNNPKNCPKVNARTRARAR